MANKDLCRMTRNQPFCWQEKAVLRFLRKKYKGLELSRLRNLYLTLTEMSSDFMCGTFKFYTKTIETYSGLARDWIPKGLKIFQQLGIIEIHEIRQDRGRFGGKEIIFTPEKFMQKHKLTVNGNPVNGKTVDGSTVNGNPAYKKKYSLLEEMSLLEEGGEVVSKNPGNGKKPRPYPTNSSSTSPPPTDKGFSDNSAGGARTPTSPVTDEMLADVVTDTGDDPPKINKSLTEIANKEHRIVALVEFVRDLYTNKLGYAHPDWIMPPYSTQYYQKLSALCEDDGMAAKLCQTVEWIAKCNPKHDMSMLEFVKAIEDRAYSFQEKKKPYDIKRVQGSFLERKQHQKNAAEARPSYGMITG